MESSQERCFSFQQLDQVRSVDIFSPDQLYERDLQFLPVDFLPSSNNMYPEEDSDYLIGQQKPHTLIGNQNTYKYQHYNHQHCNHQKDLRDTNKSGTSLQTNTSGQIGAAVRRCTCKNSRCLKNYCECFKLGLPCTQECGCKNCCNKIKLFSQPAVIKEQQIKCRCQKSKCVKKYCQCHSAGKKCGKQCQCLQCQNQQTIKIQSEDIVRKRVKSDPQIQIQNFLF